MNKTRWGFSCLFKGKGRVENEVGAVLAARTISVEEASLLSVGDAKNKAIRKFVSEIGALLDDIKQ